MAMTDPTLEELWIDLQVLLVQRRIGALCEPKEPEPEPEEL